MRTLRLTAATFLAVAALSWPTPASAGGPTSVLLVNSDQESTASLHITEPRYAQLEAALHNPKGGSVVPAPPQDGTFITATWLRHNVTVWRVDRIYMDAPGGPLFSTERVEGEGEPTPTTGREVWHKPFNVAQLRGVVKALKLWNAPAQAPAPQAESIYLQEPAQKPTLTQAKDDPITKGWWWALPGLLAGTLLTAASLRRRRPKLPHPEEPAQELLDRPIER